MENEDIEELEIKYKELGEKIEKLKSKKIAKRWRAEKSDDYYFIDDLGEINHDYEEGTNTDYYRYKTRNYFKTSGEAQEYLDNTNTYFELMNLAEELNNGEEIDWDNKEQSKCYLSYDFFNEEICLNIIYGNKHLGQIYCLDKNFLDKALERIGEEKLKKLFKNS